MLTPLLPGRRRFRWSASAPAALPGNAAIRPLLRTPQSSTSNFSGLERLALSPHRRVEEPTQSTQPRLAEKHSVSGQVRHQRSELVRGRVGCADLATKAPRFEISGSPDLAPLFPGTQASPRRGYGSRPRTTTEAGKFVAQCSGHRRHRGLWLEGNC